VSAVPPEVRSVGERGILLQLEDNASVHAVASAARERFGDALEEVVPGHLTVLLVWHDGIPADVVVLMSDLKALAELPSAFKSDVVATRETEVQPIAVPVVYDGEDLECVAEALELSVEALTELHARVVFRVAFMGFTPGFPYLIADGAGEGWSSDDGSSDGRAGACGPRAAAALLALPRLATPRTEVPAGSVAVAAGYCGIYPRSSPGGWNLLGRTDAVLFDAERERPALLEPGMAVRFVRA
jgi:allophanate hydrolase subunit 1